MRIFGRLFGILALLATALPNPASAQLPGGGVSQQGAVTIGNCTKWVGNALIADAGSGCGGSGSPGGTPNQVQYNAAGSFGGFTVSGDATLVTSTGALTLSTVNGNVGSFGSATQCVAITVNAKGLITAASASTCTPAIGSVSGLGTGVATWLATPSSANLAAALTDETGSGAAVFGTAPTISSINATTAATLAFITGSTQCLHVNTSGAISGTGSDCGSGGSSTITAGSTATSGITTGHFLGASSNLVVDATAITSVTTACGATGGPITSSGQISATITSRAVTGTSDTILSTDCGNIVYYNNASGVAITQPAPTGLFVNGFFTTICNINAGIGTVTPGSGNIGGASTYPLPGGGTAAAPVCTTYQSDGTNFNVVPSFMVNAALLTAGTLPAGRMPALTGDITTSAGAVATTLATVNSNVGTFGSATQAPQVTVNGKGLVTAASNVTVTPAVGSVTGLGTGVATAAGTTLSAAGGLTSTIASGTSAMGTGAITSATCATVVTTTATNTATTDVVLASFNGDPTAVTGYVPLTAGMLTIIAYPTSGNVNFKVCNNTAGSITPGAITLNWRVLR